MHQSQSFAAVQHLCCFTFQVFEQLLVHGSDATAALHNFFQILKWSFDTLLSGVFPDRDWTGEKHLGQISLFGLIPEKLGTERRLVCAMASHFQCFTPTHIHSLARYNAGTTGFLKAGQFICGGYSIALVSVQGDLDFFAASLGLPRWSLAAGGCPVCKCKAFGDMTWKKFYPPEHVINMEWMPQEWLDWEGKSTCPLFEAIGVTACSVMLDWMHVKYLGNDQYVYASVFYLLCFVVLPQTPLQNLLSIWEEMKGLYQSLNIIHRYHYFNRLTMFVRKSGPPKLRGKAAEVHHLHKVILQLWLQHYNENIAVHRQILLLLRLNSKIEDLLDEYRQDVALPAGPAKDLLDSCSSMCHLQSLLYDHFSQEDVQLFNYTLKTHDIIHLAAHSHQINPRLVWNFCGESNMGILKQLGSTCVKGVAPQDACTKMLHHWSFGMHYELQG